MKHNPLILIIFLIVSAIAPSTLSAQESVRFSDWFCDSTLRVDYVRRGDARHDTLLFKRYVMKGGGWAGSKNELLDPFDNGMCRVSVVDPASRQVLYCQYYNSLFREYAETPEGDSLVKDFEEVVLLPWPKKTVEIHMDYRDARNQMHTQAVWTFGVGSAEPSHYFRVVNHHQKTYTLQYSGDPSQKVDVVIVAQGYKPNARRKMLKDLDRFKEAMLAQEPFASHRQDFNIYAVCGDAGAEFNTFGIDRYLMTQKLFKLHNLISSVPYDHIVIMVNTPKYGGGAIYNFYAVSTLHAMFSMILPHELGHSIGGLADEYVEEGMSYESLHHASVEPTEPNITALVDFDSKWKDLVPEGTPVPTPPVKGLGPRDCGPVGVYEGAGYQPKGLYRPVTNCMMNYYADFCPVCIRRLEEVFSHYCR